MVIMRYSVITYRDFHCFGSLLRRPLVDISHTAPPTSYPSFTRLVHPHLEDPITFFFILVGFHGPRVLFLAKEHYSGRTTTVWKGMKYSGDVEASHQPTWSWILSFREKLWRRNLQDFHQRDQQEPFWKKRWQLETIIRQVSRFISPDLDTIGIKVNNAIVRDPLHCFCCSWTFQRRHSAEQMVERL